MYPCRGIPRLPQRRSGLQVIVDLKTGYDSSSLAQTGRWLGGVVEYRGSRTPEYIEQVNDKTGAVVRKDPVVALAGSAVTSDHGWELGPLWRRRRGGLSTLPPRLRTARPPSISVPSKCSLFGRPTASSFGGGPESTAARRRANRSRQVTCRPHPLGW